MSTKVKLFLGFLLITVAVLTPLYLLVNIETFIQISAIYSMIAVPICAKLRQLYQEPSPLELSKLFEKNIEEHYKQKESKQSLKISMYLNDHMKEGKYERYELPQLHLIKNLNAVIEDLFNINMNASNEKVDKVKIKKWQKMLSNFLKHR